MRINDKHDTDRQAKTTMEKLKNKTRVQCRNVWTANHDLVAGNTLVCMNINFCVMNDAPGCFWRIWRLTYICAADSLSSLTCLIIRGITELADCQFQQQCQRCVPSLGSAGVMKRSLLWHLTRRSWIKSTPACWLIPGRWHVLQYLHYLSTP